MKIDFLNGRTVAFPNRVLSQILEAHEDDVRCYLATELYLIDAGSVPLAPGWEVSKWGD